MDGRSVNIASVVEELFFKDQYLEHLCHVGLTKQLTRTADGGNDAIRVKELAEMVKALRKAVQSYQKKLQELLQSVDRPPESDQNEAGIQTGLLANIETQTSPQANNLEMRQINTENSRSPHPGNAEANTLRQELWKTKQDLQDALDRYAELTHQTSEIPPSTTGIPRSPAPSAAVQKQASAILSSPCLVRQAPLDAPPQSLERAVAAKTAAAEEAAGLREQVQALQEEIASLQAANARVQSEFEQATAARKSAESTARECGVALKQKDAELSFVKMTNENDAQRDKDMIQKLQTAIEGHKKDLQFERDTLHEMEYKEKQATAKRAQLEREVASLRQKASQDTSGRGEIWSKLMKQREEHEAAIGEKETELEAEKTNAMNSQKTADRLRRELDLVEADHKRAQEEAELARQERADINNQLLDITRKNVSLTQDLHDAQHELNSVRTTFNMKISAAESRVEAAEERVRDAVKHAADLKVRLEACTEEKESALKAAESRRSEITQCMQDMKKFKAELHTVAAERDRLGAELSQAAEEIEERTKRETEAQGISTSAQEAEQVARVQLQAAQEALLSEQCRAEAAEAECKAAREQQEVVESQMEALQEAAGCGDPKLMVGQLGRKVGHLETALAEAERQRRKLHNALVEIRGNIRVFCRLKPCTSPPAVTPLHGDGVRAVVEGKPHDFYFDRVLGPNTTQEAAFTAVSDIVQSALDGYHVCLFSYGQTGSGKTYTMIGNGGAGASAASAPGRGVIPRAVSMMLASAARLGAAGWTFRMEATFIEVYNEALRDLLAEPERGPGHSGGARVLDSAAIKHDPNAHTQIAGATRMVVDSEEVAQELLRRAARARSTDATAMNAESSRSHSVFTLHITGTNEAGDCRLLGSLSLVDLAGSERLARSGAEGARQKETCAINKSLSSLGDIFQALSSKSAHVPYRNSKLTYLLQPALGGDGKTLMFVNINPELPSAYESLCALRFAAKVNAVETAAQGRGGARRNVVGSVPPSSTDTPPSGGGGSHSAPLPSEGGAQRRGSMAPTESAGSLRRASVIPAARSAGLPRAPLIPVKRNAPGQLTGTGAPAGKERPSSGPRSSSLPAFKRRR